MALSKETITLQDYLKHEMADGKTEFRVTAQPEPKGPGVKIYIHPLGKDGESRDFIIDGELTHDVSQFLPS